jgi:hypothetical protein
LTALLTALVLLARLLFIPKVERASPLATRKRRSKQSASLEPNRVTIVMQVREVLEVYHADLPVGRFPFRRLVSVHGSGAVPCQAEPFKRIHPLNRFAD